MSRLFTTRRSILAAAVLAAASVGLSAPALAQDASKKQLVIGGTAGSNIDQLQYGIVPQLQKKGYKVKLVEFNDYVQPNLALADGSLDANFFQHEVYFNQFKGDRKLDLVALTQGPIAPMGVYSKQRKSLADLKEGDRVALPNDPSNLARGILLLQQAGLVKIKEGVNPLRVSELDLASNPKKIKLVPLDAAHLPRALDDTQFAIINGNFAISSGLKLTEAVLLEKVPDHYLNIVAVKTKDKDAQWAKDLAEAYRSADFKAVVDSKFAGYAKPGFLQ
ncbi:MetQ/NlpA family ABC transporter substrate-binding protein [Comamonas terrigena]|jgi:D-methionine transport system substrate-binding protein|uniref:Lipoprotein n=1 Tax=Comamonas terrigena TaxID=32013 RepID=A0A2A7UX95_COMTR|nr:MetQ/NlpA family ABC transporter substrate-binding protein [Comamonas terrigena]MDH0050923.1 MetQ/NlpA family ABC transporter substrate-binding protein [Comamonas terrigena]MDH0513267.1 MetQ/NlpA family ABC transporter substrate-binding protein [Comamonas terrigena]MDH1092687.1 MetQ/NlpA family ABC transporter substrate-binding protein [Comamonas terrigena]MDH1292753.1 MetQ/NlpA family ABC transporter substrate-binding protein [Comamonas terrigena]MDH1502871.1 MetQ/NlpA family ABC transport